MFGEKQEALSLGRFELVAILDFTVCFK